MITQVYRSKKKEGAYLYVKKSDNALAQIPDGLKSQLGKLEPAMVLVLTPDKKLARAEAEKVINAIEDQGFYLQLPPAPDEYMQQIPNDKMGR